ncbi:MAG: autoinducer binding domain-containing protein [Pseudomonadota bacterium]
MLEEYYENVIAVDSTIDKFDELYNLGKRLGFNDIYYSRIISEEESARFNSLNINRMRRGSDKWMEIYERQRYHQIDWALEHAVSEYSPFRLDNVPDNLTDNQSEFVKHARAHNRQNGFALPIRNGLGLTAGFSATGALHRPDDLSIAKLIAAAQFFDLLVCADITQTRATQFSLTKREIRLLKLFVNGRSMAQIAHFVGATEQWIRKSFLDMRKKMKANSNSELVYRAVSLKIIN